MNDWGQMDFKYSISGILALMHCIEWFCIMLFSFFADE